MRLWAEWTDASAADHLVRLVEDGEVVNRRWKTALKEGAKVQVTYDQLVRGGDRIRSCQVLVVPGLLQTRDYARAQKLAAWRPLGIDTAGVEDTIDAAMRRQEALYDQSKTFEFYFTAAALDYWPCPASVMACAVRPAADRFAHAQRHHRHRAAPHPAGGHPAAGLPHR